MERESSDDANGLEIDNKNIDKFTAKKNVWLASPLLFIVNAVVFLMAIVSFFWDEKIFIVEILISALLFILSCVVVLKSKYYMREVSQSLRKAVENIDNNVLEKMKSPVVVIHQNYDISYCNPTFRECLCMGRDCTGETILQFIKENSLRDVLNGKEVDISFKESKYTVYGVKNDKAAIVYFIDNTEYKILREEMINNRPVVMSVVFDNIDEFVTDSEDKQAIRILLEVENTVHNWVSENEGLFEKLSDRKYIAIFEDKSIRKFISEKFNILERVKNIKLDDRKYATISIGVGRWGRDLRESEALSNKALDMALGRGGDQAAITQKNGMLKFFGGISETSGKKSKVRARVIAYKILDHINLSSNVIIMGHKYSDLDSIGSSVGIYSVIKNYCKKNAYILINKSETVAKNLVDEIEHKYGKSPFISEEKAEEIIDDNTLVIILDTHSKNFLESEKLYQKAQKVVVIDHHRMTVDRVDNAVVFYHEPAASSASEMVTELVQYMDSGSLGRTEAKSLLSGIMLDTKNFVIKTSSRTFEAAAYLRRKGADTIAVKRLFADSMAAYKFKCELISKAEIFEKCAIVCVKQKCDNINMKVICAQVADDLLNIENIIASFVIYDISGSINVSARSLGDVNVQLIMESMGGGGHQSMAGTQISNKNLLDVKDNLKEILKNI